MNCRLLSLSALALLLLDVHNVAAQTFTDVAIGSSHMCAVTDTSDVECTTTSFAQRYDAPEGLAQMIDLAAGDQHTCGIDLEGQAVCWSDGQSEFGAFNQLNIPAITQPLVSIAAGANHTCAVDVDGRAWCWGLDTNQQTQPPGDGYGNNGAGFIQVDGGLNFSCGIQTDGDIVCWTNDGGFSRGTTISGPFVDLDISYRNACGIKSDGTIDCWRSRFDPPNNGPYTDLVVSRSAICGLNQNKTVDCTFASDFEPTLPVFPEGTQFNAIESAPENFYRELPFCGLTVSGSIECASSRQFEFLSPPGSADSSDQTLTGVNFVLSARAYSKNKIELFWNNPPARYGDEQILIEVYRNDVLLDTTKNSSSWYDPTEQTENPLVYRIRAVDGLGRVGPFSKTVTVDNDIQRVTYDEPEVRFDIVKPKHTVDSLRMTFAGNDRVIVWSGSVPGSDGLKGYELRINNEPVIFTDSFVHRLESFNSGDCNRISVAAVSEQGTYFDYRTIVTNRFSRNYSSCFDRF